MCGNGVPSIHMQCLCYLTDHGEARLCFASTEKTYNRLIYIITCVVRTSESTASLLLFSLLGITACFLFLEKEGTSTITFVSLISFKVLLSCALNYR